VGATLGATRMNNLRMIRTRPDNRGETSPRSRTDLNGSGRPRGYLRIRRLGVRVPPSAPRSTALSPISSSPLANGFVNNRAITGRKSSGGRCPGRWRAPVSSSAPDPGPLGINSPRGDSPVVLRGQRHAFPSLADGRHLVHDDTNGESCKGPHRCLRRASVLPSPDPPRGNDCALLPSPVRRAGPAGPGRKPRRWTA
jgi:hypothetical protein